MHGGFEQWCVISDLLAEELGKGGKGANCERDLCGASWEDRRALSQNISCLFN